MTSVKIMPAPAIIARTARYLAMSLVNRKSKGFGNMMLRTSSPLAVANPSNDKTLHL